MWEVVDMAVWNPWHGCRKISPGCLNCYVYRRDAEFGKDSSLVAKTANFGLPIRRGRDGGYKLRPDGGQVYACMTSDFFLEEADGWRAEAWAMIRERSDLRFTIITKRIHRFRVGLPSDWGEGYGHVTICCTCEDQRRADLRLPAFLELPIRHRAIIHEPMLGRVDIRKHLATGLIEQVTCGGESGPGARLCDFAWVLDTMGQCVEWDVPFWFKQTGANFRKGDRVYRIPRKDQMEQAKKAGVDYRFGPDQESGDSMDLSTAPKNDATPRDGSFA